MKSKLDKRLALAGLSREEFSKQSKIRIDAVQNACSDGKLATMTVRRLVEIAQGLDCKVSDIFDDEIIPTDRRGELNHVYNEIVKHLILSTNKKEIDIFARKFAIAKYTKPQSLKEIAEAYSTTETAILVYMRRRLAIIRKNAK